MQHIQNYMPNFDQILDLQLVAKEAGYSTALDKFVLQFFGGFVDKTCRKRDWGLRPLTLKEMEYCMDDATWLPKVFAKLRPLISNRHFAESKEMFEKNKLKVHTYQPSQFGAGDKPKQHQEIMYYIWQKREKEAERPNCNIGKIYGKNEFKELGARLYKKWFEENDKDYFEFVSFEQFISGKVE